MCREIASRENLLLMYRFKIIPFTLSASPWKRHRLPATTLCLASLLLHLAFQIPSHTHLFNPVLLPVSPGHVFSRQSRPPTSSPVTHPPESSFVHNPHAIVRRTPSKFCSSSSLYSGVKIVALISQLFC